MATTSITTPSVYGDDRVRRLRIAVGSLAGTALIGAGIGLYVLITGDTDDAGVRRSGTVLTVLSLILLVACAATWFALPQRSPAVRRACAACGFLAMIFALPTAGLVLGFVWAVLGLAILFLALGPDEA